jgi:hypothetical protein
MSAPRAAASTFAVLALGLALCAPAPRAQTIRGPEETRPELPTFPAPSDQPPLALPPVGCRRGARAPFVRATRIRVELAVTGSSVFDRPSSPRARPDQPRDLVRGADRRATRSRGSTSITAT